MAAASPRRRPGTLERPISTRIYRAAWTLVAIPLLVAGLTVGRPQALSDAAPRVDPPFDEAVAAAFAAELTRRFPDRVPGTTGANAAAEWVSRRLRAFELKPERQTFSADVPGVGETELTNLVAVAPGRSPETIVVMAHRDNAEPWSARANDNASGTGALLELARDLESAPPPAHTLVFLSSDGGATGGFGAAEFARDTDLVKRLVGRGAAVVAVVNLDAIAGQPPPRLVFAGDAARSAATALVASADASVLASTRSRAALPSAPAQLLDLAFPFTVHEQGPFVAHGIPGVTLTTGGERQLTPSGERALDLRELGGLGRSAQTLVGWLDGAAEVAHGTDSYLYFRSWFVRGWTIQFLLLVGLVPFLAATVDLSARCRRRGLPLRPALRSLVSRVAVLGWIAVLLLVFRVSGLISTGSSRPINPDLAAAHAWPTGALAALLALAATGWLVARPRLTWKRDIDREEELAGFLAATLALAVVALIVAATNPFALLFVLPSAHAWLWLAQVPRSRLALRLALYALGFAGPAALVVSFALRFALAADAVWYLLLLGLIGYVATPLLVAALVWAAVAAQVGALAVGRYAPYPPPAARAPRGPIRNAIRYAVLFTRSRRAARRRHGPALRPSASGEREEADRGAGG